MNTSQLRPKPRASPPRPPFVIAKSALTASRDDATIRQLHSHMLRRIFGRRAVLTAALAVLAGLLIGAASAPPEQGSAAARTVVSTAVDTAHKLFQIVGIIFAGLFAYYKFFRGRTFRPRLEPALEAEITELGPLRHLKVHVRVKNVGLSKVGIDRKASGLRVFVYDGNGAPADKLSPVEWRRERTVDVFKDHAWVEPGETIEDNWLLSIPHSKQPAAFRLELKLAGPKTDWYANAVIEAPAQPAPGILRGLLGYLLPSSQQRHSGGYDE